jgi:hypothetical protein
MATAAVRRASNRVTLSRILRDPLRFVISVAYLAYHGATLERSDWFSCHQLTWAVMVRFVPFA